MIDHTSCPVCGQGKFSPFITCKDRLVTGEVFPIVKCDTCEFRFTNPVPEPKDLYKYYESSDYISHSNESKGLISKVYYLVRRYTLGKKVRLISRYVSRGTILDYGAGTGAFLAACKSAGWKTAGVEPDPGAREAAAKTGLELSESTGNLDNTVPFDIITLWHVLEHVYDLKNTLEFFRTNLSKNGRLIIAVPNFRSHDAEYYGPYWAAYDVPRHLYHFEKKTLSGLLENYGFTLEHTLPMKFDSYYVSMLSEKYKHGHVNYFKAFWRGFISNRKGRGPGNYSSLIYVFKHK